MAASERAAACPMQTSSLAARTSPWADLIVPTTCMSSFPVILANLAPARRSRSPVTICYIITNPALSGKHWIRSSLRRAGCSGFSLTAQHPHPHMFHTKRLPPRIHRPLRLSPLEASRTECQNIVPLTNLRAHYPSLRPRATIADDPRALQARMKGAAIRR